MRCERQFCRRLGNSRDFGAVNFRRKSPGSIAKAALGKRNRSSAGGRAAVETGLNELRTGIRCLDHFSARGRHTSEQLDPTLVDRIHAIVEPDSQADPKFQTPLAFTRVTAKAVRGHLRAEAPEASQPAPAERTIHDILNRLGYCLRRVRKTKVQKKFPKPTPSSIT